MRFGPSSADVQVKSIPINKYISFRAFDDHSPSAPRARFLNAYIANVAGTACYYDQLEEEQLNENREEKVVDPSTQKEDTFWDHQTVQCSSCRDDMPILSDHIRVYMYLPHRKPQYPGDPCELKIYFCNENCQQDYIEKSARMNAQKRGFVFIRCRFCGNDQNINKKTGECRRRKACVQTRPLLCYKSGCRASVFFTDTGLCFYHSMNTDAPPVFR